MEKKKSAFEVYLSVVYKWGIITLVCACMCAAVLYTFMKIIGLFLTISWGMMLVFDIMDVCFLVGGLILVRTSFVNGELKKNRLAIGKAFAFITLIIQWNYILYMVSSKTFWGVLFFFIILMAFFLDMKLALGACITCIVSLVISWGISGNNLPAWDAIFITDLINCIVALFLSTVGLGMFIFFMTRFKILFK